MTEQEWGFVGAIVSATVASVGYFVRYAVDRLTKSADDTRVALKESTATVAVNTEVTRQFSTDVRQLFSRLDKQSSQIDGVADFVERELTPLRMEIPRRTPPLGLPVIEAKRALTKKDGDR